MDNARIISLGSINVDFQVRADRWPEAGEVLAGSDFLMAAGGKAANLAFQVRRLGADVQLIARTGENGLAVFARAPLVRVDAIYAIPYQFLELRQVLP